MRGSTLPRCCIPGFKSIDYFINDRPSICPVAFWSKIMRRRKLFIARTAPRQVEAISDFPRMKFSQRTVDAVLLVLILARFTRQCTSSCNPNVWRSIISWKIVHCTSAHTYNIWLPETFLELTMKSARSFLALTEGPGAAIAVLLQVMASKLS